MNVIRKIIDLLPAPKEQWEAYEWSIVSIADTSIILLRITIRGVLFQ